jgi:YD repeat-containing protein
VTDPAPFQAQTVQTTYEDALNRKTETDRDGIATVTQTDPMGRVVSVTRADVPVEAHTYDAAGNRLSSMDGDLRLTLFTYDRANRLVAREDGAGTATAAATTYEYADRCNQTSERDRRAYDLGSPFSVKREYDGLHRLERVTDDEGLVTEYGYDDEGHKTRVREPEGQVTQFEYDELGKLTQVTQPPPAGQPAPVTRYEYDPARNPVTQTDARGKVVHMTYDKLNPYVPTCVRQPTP